MLDYSNLIRPDYRYTYAIYDTVTGEVHATSCDHASYAVAHLYRLMMSFLREARRNGWAADWHLVNANTGEELLSCAL